ncbi:hypothetical protein LTR99_009621 [Exophiala xenobiotica]|uniref:RING-type E3 ubiquitin transferase n=1 Tax=Vermiconidia calcicola TaxID=1690605 RepID=A0AAV9PVL1_9PEZI|nr:hypothetical protein LTR96_001721 [Exophiala xenobiotica]KAK5530459.1 hypothetical protein LTR25_009037 [Vermiconidia calcicola]KAK5539100.1 hypothetical protein LTR23_006914 [Chaetothyriales sp. CCFEE 6169]KAK5294223.1 hypothetical protein LTR99_009621 [Exophiala xenobiotica]KAK5336116.1 hypothetical protein LTR98_007446 [Exophiala xenobiotica]
MTFSANHLMAEHPDENELTLDKTARSGPVLTTPSLQDANIPPPETCVICLEHISEKAIALPCRHEQFDFPCLGTWLQRQQVCPLCKRQVKAIRFNVGERDTGGSQVFYLPEAESSSSSLERRRFSTAAAAAPARHRRARHEGPYVRGGAQRVPVRSAPASQGSKDTSLDVRRQVYRHKLYSLHVGTNRISRYRNLTPASFAKDERLTSRARMWIRRELQVFEFLNPSSSRSSTSSSTNSVAGGDRDRRANNADFLLEYIIAILKSIDLKGSTGQAEEVLKDFLGRENARLFLHDLEAWLRSPYEYLRDWDRAVQYPAPPGAEHEDDTTSESQCRHSEPNSSSDRLHPRINDRTATVPRWFSDEFVLGGDGHRNRPS